MNQPDKPENIPEEYLIPLLKELEEVFGAKEPEPPPKFPWE